MTLRKQFLNKLKSDHQENSKEWIKNSTYMCKVWYYPEKAWFLFEDTIIDFALIRQLIDEKVLIFKGIKLHQAIKMALYEPDFTHSAFNYTSNLHIQKNVTN